LSYAEIKTPLDRVDGFDTKLDGLEAFKFTAVLDNQSLEQIKEHDFFKVYEMFLKECGEKNAGTEATHP
jgi:hypothetical protein